jgi:D-lactate dehydrogenase (cytochrome)
MAEAARLTERLVARALAMGGTCSGEHGVGLDPRNLMNPGKLLPE